MTRLSTIVISVLAPTFACQPASAATETSWLLKILEKSKSEVAKVLGKSTVIKHEDSVPEYVYQKATFAKVVACFAGEKGLQYVKTVFKTQPKTWQEALAQLGIPSKGCKVEENKIPDLNTSTFTIKGIVGVPKGWDVYFAPQWVDDRDVKPKTIPGELVMYESNFMG